MTRSHPLKDRDWPIACREKKECVGGGNRDSRTRVRWAPGGAPRRYLGSLDLGRPSV